MKHIFVINPHSFRAYGGTEAFQKQVHDCFSGHDSGSAATVFSLSASTAWWVFITLSLRAFLTEMRTISRRFSAAARP
ncbi:MAG: hypothetical protein FWD35_05320 [Oscillospiraceae bacterium]|nr:hypothetical protein [Oscillospiraceae bacterium]